jgi:hypothetical protein
MVVEPFVKQLVQEQESTATQIKVLLSRRNVLKNQLDKVEDDMDAMLRRSEAITDALRTYGVN